MWCYFIWKQVFISIPWKKHSLKYIHNVLEPVPIFYLHYTQVTFFPWPSWSLDLSCIEHVRVMIGRRFGVIMDLNHLRHAVQVACDSKH